MKKITIGIGIAALAAFSFAPLSHAADEMAKKEKWFAKADTNKDSSLSKEEYMTACEKQIQEKAKKSGAKADADAPDTADTGDNMQ